MKAKLAEALLNINSFPLHFNPLLIYDLCRSLSNFLCSYRVMLKFANWILTSTLLNMFRVLTKRTRDHFFAKLMRCSHLLLAEIRRGLNRKAILIFF